MAKYRLSRRASSDIEGIAQYSAERFGTRQAIAYVTDIHDAARLVAEISSLGRPYTTKKGRTYQRYNVGNHALFYRTTDEGVFVVRILHQAMDLDRRLDGGER